MSEDQIKYIVVESPEHYKELTGKDWKSGGGVKFEYSDFTSIEDALIDTGVDPYPEPHPLKIVEWSGWEYEGE